MRTAYLTDLSDAEWSYLEPHFPALKVTGRPRLHHIREILDAIFFYILRSGCAWRLLPHDDFPPWKTLHHYYFRTSWRIDGTWEKLNAALCESACVPALSEIPNPAQL